MTDSQLDVFLIALGKAAIELKGSRAGLLNAKQNYSETTQRNWVNRIAKAKVEYANTREAAIDALNTYHQAQVRGRV